MASSKDTGSGHWVDEKPTSDADDVLVLSQDEDRYMVVKEILRYFERKGLVYNYPDLHYRPGRSEAESMSDAIKRSKHVLMILSSTELLLPLEIFLALEKSVKSQQLCITVLMTKEFKKSGLKGLLMLQLAEFFQLDHNCLEHCLEELIKHIKVTKPLEDLLPAGNFATGLAWSHFFGFLQIILPKLQKEIRETSLYRENPGCFPEKFYILLPKTARAGKLTEMDSRIEMAYENIDNSCVTIKDTVAGADRTYKAYIYKIKDDDGREYYCCAEIPSAFSSIGETLSRVCKMTTEQRNLEVERFFYKLEEILNRDSYRDCQGIAQLIPFDDEAKGEEGTPSYHLLRNIQQKGKISPENLYKGERKFETDVCLVYGENNKDWANHVRYTLEEKKEGSALKMSKVILPKEHFHEAEKRMVSARWILLFISKDRGQNEWVPLWLAELLSLSIQENVLRVLIVLGEGATTDEIPHFIRWVTYVDKRDRDYTKKIRQIIDGESPRMSDLTPVGNVACGMAWAFFYNYLHYALENLEKRSVDKLKQLTAGPTATCVPVVFEFIPLSCECPNELQKVEHKDYQIQDLGRINPIKKDVSGISREFGFQMFKILAKDKRQEQEHFFMGEFATPIRTLHKMHRDLKSGLNNEQKEKQAEVFHDELKTLINNPELPKAIRGKCKVVMYDDSRENLIDVILKKIKETEKEFKTWSRME